MVETYDNLIKDIEAIKKISIVPTMLDVVCQVTGMRFATIARVTETRWIACSVKDDIEFGLKPGDELVINTTICDEIRASSKPVIIDDVDADEHYKDHHTPKMYGFKSYISFPIFLHNGDFFGTLCAIDPKPAHLNNPKVIGLFTMFAELLSFHLSTVDLMDLSLSATKELSSRNNSLKKVNRDQDNLLYTISHDLKAPFSNLEGLIEAISLIIDKDSPSEADIKEIKQLLRLMGKSVDRFSLTLHELTSLIRTQVQNETLSEAIELNTLVENIKLDILDLVKQSNATIKVDIKNNFPLPFSKTNLKSIFYNLINNSIKYKSPEREPEILVRTEEWESKKIISVRDNGLGIPSDKKGKVFDLFERIHTHVEGTGIGLYLVKKIVKEAGGDILIDSEVGKGTEFKIVLP